MIFCLKDQSSLSAEEAAKQYNDVSVILRTYPELPNEGLVFSNDTTALTRLWINGLDELDENGVNITTLDDVLMVTDYLTVFDNMEPYRYVFNRILRIH